MRRSSSISFLLLIFLFLTVIDVSAQKKTKEQLNKEKTENLQKIKETEAILAQTEKKKKATVGQLNAINEQIRTRELLINSIEEEIDWFSSKIEDNLIVVQSLQTDIRILKNEYAEMAYAGFKSIQNQDKLTFLFASNSFNQFLIRLKYFEQYGEARRYQAEQIMKVQDILSSEIDGYDTLLSDKQSLLAEELSQRDELSGLKLKQSQLISSLSKKENELKRELDTRTNAVATIGKLIDNIIKEELRALAKNSAPELKVVSSNFAGNQRLLPWPVTEGFISSGYGKHNHPVYKRVVIDNKGVYIQTKENAEIKAVFEGKVSVVASIPGMNKAVIIQHGDYRTVYANLKEVFVKPNQVIKINDKIGDIYTDSDGLSELYFEVWKNNSTLNPQLWLTKK